MFLLPPINITYQQRVGIILLVKGSKKLLQTNKTEKQAEIAIAFFWVFQGTVSLCKLGCPGTCSMNSWMLGPKVYPTTAPRPYYKNIDAPNVGIPNFINQ